MTERPKVIVWFEEVKRILEEKEGPFCKYERKIMDKLGYRLCYWYLQEAEDYGYVLVQ
jgi:site-specific DNA-cytosine methylase